MPVDKEQRLQDDYQLWCTALNALGREEEWGQQTQLCQYEDVEIGKKKD